MEIKITGNYKRATTGSVGIDLICSKTTFLKKDNYTLIPTTFQTIIPEGMLGLITPRSSTAYKKGIEVVIGTIDSDYRGCWGIVAKPSIKYENLREEQRGKVFKYLLNSNEDFENVVEQGECIAQAIFIPSCISQLEMISKEQYDNFVKQEQNNQRGEGGFGSTGV